LGIANVASVVFVEQLGAETSLAGLMILRAFYAFFDFASFAFSAFFVGLEALRAVRQADFGLRIVEEVRETSFTGRGVITSLAVFDTLLTLSSSSVCKEAHTAVRSTVRVFEEVTILTLRAGLAVGAVFAVHFARFAAVVLLVVVVALVTVWLTLARLVFVRSDAVFAGFGVVTFATVLHTSLAFIGGSFEEAFATVLDTLSVFLGQIVFADVAAVGAFALLTVVGASLAFSRDFITEEADGAGVFADSF